MRLTRQQRRDAPRWPAASGAPTLAAPTALPSQGGRTRKSRAGCIARTLLLVALLIVVAVGITTWRLTATTTNYTGAHFNQGHNAVWLEHTWAGESHSSAAYDQLAAQLAHEQIGYVYAHVGPLESTGTIPATLAPNAARLADALHARLPHLQVLAWIGQVEAASGLPPDQVVNLDDSQVRARIAATAAHFVLADGFDGIHYDIEPILNNNPRFLDLLDETRAATPTGTILSISAQKWAPNATIANLAFHTGHAGAWWTSYYFASVASHVDQLVVMSYDTGMPTAALYQVAIKQETQHILEAARTARHPPQVLMGIPTYAGASVWFHDSAEKMDSALHGIIAGLNSDAGTGIFTGVAVYRLATTQESAWATYDKLWLGR